MKRAPLFLAAVLMLVANTARSDESPFFVIDYGLTYESFVTQDPPDGKRLRSPIKRRKPLYFWTRIAGDQRALEVLRRVGEVPIRHRWYVRCTLSSAEESIKQESDIFVGGAKADPAQWEALLAKLQSEIALNSQHGKRPIFDWRTQSEKEYVPSCNYQILIVDRDDQPLRCEKLGGQCELKFRVDQ